jgi:hypothetical protein
MLVGGTWKGKLLSLAVVLLITLYFWSFSARWWFYVWLAIIALGFFGEMRAFLAKRERKEPELIDVVLDDDQPA